MDIRIAVFAVALTLAAQASAQQTIQPSIWHAAATPATAPSTYIPMLAGQALEDRLSGSSLRAGDGESTAPANRNVPHIAFKAQSDTAALTRQLLYTTSPLWLHHSRPFPSDSHVSQSGEPLLNQAAAMAWSSSTQ
ncbi:hypothetical protein [Dyella acidiphila]|uniref:Uncharacterized protein n=1 Tax=Dyella acidiphila TaxID=2775866 RepID=A0ABR9GA90_9GAMM|nr:hypothetical protein [Dyella acidiphila]MBE1160978.1 hypothetical protein [Dyella acidiphila]